MAPKSRKPIFTVNTLRPVLQRSNKFDQVKDEFESLCQILAKHLIQNTSVDDVSKCFRNMEKKLKRRPPDVEFAQHKTNLCNRSYLQKHRDVQLSALHDQGYKCETDIFTNAYSPMIYSQEDEQTKSSRPNDELKQNESSQKEKESHSLLDALEELKPKVMTLLDLTDDSLSQKESSCECSEEKAKKKQKKQSKRPEKLRDYASPVEFVQYTSQVLDYTKRLFPRLHDLKQCSKAIEDFDAWVTSTEESLMSGEVISPLPVTQDSCQNTSLDPLIKTRKRIMNIYDDYLKLKSEKDKQQEHDRNREEDTQMKIQSLQEELRVCTANLNKTQNHEKELTKSLEDFKIEAKETLARQMTLKDSEIKQLQSDKNELLNRISRNAEMRLKEGNSGITDLSDPNRPTKLAEKIGELYDDEWTEAFDELLNKEMSEIEAIGILLQILRAANIFCKEQADSQWEDICKAICRKSIIMPFPSTSVNDLRNVRRITANISAESVVEEYFRCKLPDVDITPADAGACLEAYIKKCVELCWLMETQTQPPWLHFDVKYEDPFDEDNFKFYTCRGKTVHFLVWPALQSRENGDLLRKGVCQGCKS